jgi:glycosyltransferase involved in cell wall biosynthesis
MYIQYFPDVNEFIPGKENEIFFWQRISNLNFSVLKKLLGKVKFNIHIHKAVDPGHEFFMPEKEDIEYYNITFSDWFEKKSDFLELIKSKSIYFAPRLTEGIGQSFLEAMSMGKAVVAPDKPTMNEYITNNYNGYLYDFNNPQKINFRDVKKVQENAYKYMKEGNVTWNKEKIRIIDFIKKK